MDTTIFISLAYGATALLLFALWLTSWLKARAVRRQLGQDTGA